MDIEFKYGQRKRRIVMVVGILLAVAAFGGVLATTSAPPTTAVVPMKTVLVAVADIKPHTVLDSGMFTVRSVPDDPALAQAYADTSLLLGRTSAVQIYAHQPITPNLIVNSIAGAAFSILEPGEVITPNTPEWRAVSVQVSKDRAVGGMLEVGQHVDLFTSITWVFATPAADASASPNPSQVPAEGVPPQAAEGASKATKVTWKDVQILGKGADDGIYILKVNLHQAEEINHFQALGNATFGIALRADGDYRTIDVSQYGTTNDRIIEEYNFPLPKPIDISTYPRTSPVPGPWDPNATPVPSPSDVAPSPSPVAPAPSDSPVPSASATP
jgi:Flp pilus assembly protein CpaB